MRLSVVGTRRAAATLALCGLAAGCAQATLTTSPVTKPRHHVAPGAGPTSTGNRHAAQREAARLLSLAKVPPGAVATSTHPPSLDQPAMGATVATSLVDRAHFWRVPTGLDATVAWIRAHPPRGVTASGSSSGSGPTYRTVGVGYSAPDRPGMQDLELVIGVATLPGGGSAIRADGMAIWLDPRPLSDTTTGRRVRVTVAGGCPTRDTGAAGVRAATGEDLKARLLPEAHPTAALICDYSGMNGHPVSGLLRSRRLDPRAAGKLSHAVAVLTLEHPDGEVMSCPFADGTATVLAFSYPDRPDVDLWLDRNGCTFVANGVITTRAGYLPATVSSAERTTG